LGGAVGKPGEGVDGLDEMLAKIAAPPPPPRSATPPPPGAAQNAFGAISALYAISADGVVHSINIHNAADFEPPVPFLPAGARVSGFTVINLIAYAATSHGCGGAPDAVWSIDLGSAVKTVKQWKLESGGESGDPALAFGSDATVYVAAGNELTALDAKTLELKARFLGPSTAAVIFPYKGNDLVAAASRDAISLLDSKSFVLLDHGTAGASALATFDESDGTRWLIASGANKLAAFKVVEKDGKPALEGGAVPEPLTPETFDALDAEIRSVFQPGEMITPDDVRGRHKTLNEAILADGWPTLDKARGKVVFLLDQRRVGPLYTMGHPSLEKRVLFTNAAPGTPDAAFTECNDSASNPDLVPSLVRKGYLVRTMTDPGFAGVKAHETAKRDASINSGAQILSTDYPAGETAESGFFVTVRPAGQTYPNARCNPVLKPVKCTDTMLKENR